MHLHLYIGCFIFLKSGEHMPISFSTFFALSAPRQCMRSAALAERHTPPRTRLGTTNYHIGSHLQTLVVILEFRVLSSLVPCGTSSSSHRGNGHRPQRPLYPRNITEMTI